MSEKVYPVSPEIAANAHIDNEKYQAMYEQSVNDPDTFWGEAGKRLDWFKPYTKVKNTSFDPHNVDIRWYEDHIFIAKMIIELPQHDIVCIAST